MRCVLVGVDGSPAAAEALGWAARLATGVGAELVVATAWEPDQAEVSPTFHEELRAEALATLEDEWCEPARAAGATPRAIVVNGPVEALLDTADDEHAELIVVGTVAGAGPEGTPEAEDGALGGPRAPGAPPALPIQPGSPGAPPALPIQPPGSPGAPSSADPTAARAGEHAQPLLRTPGPPDDEGLASTTFGSTSHLLAHHTTRPLAIVPTSNTTRAVGMIVVGVDGSPGSAAALAWCTDLAPTLGASVVAVMALDSAEGLNAEGTQVARRQAAEVSMATWTAALRATDVSVESVIVEHDRPVEALLATAADSDADLLVVGTRGLGGFSEVRLGGTALHLVHHRGLPVVLVPSTEDVPAPP